MTRQTTVLMYFQTLFENVTADHPLAQDEIFGPVQVLIPFETEEEAVAIANNTDYLVLSLVSGLLMVHAKCD